MKTNLNYQIRKLHLYLGLMLGIQFLMWTIGGLSFSWSDKDKIHGDLQKKILRHYYVLIGSLLLHK